MIKNLISKRIVVALLVIVFGNYFAQSYFQDSFYCFLGNSTLQITNKPFADSKLCLDLINQLQSRKQEIIYQLDGLAFQTGSAYTKSARLALVKQRNDIEKIIDQTIGGVNNLETKLYLNNKKRYFAKVKPIRAQLIAKQAVLNADLAHSIVKGDLGLTTKLIHLIGFNYQRIKLIEGILASKSLDEMMPLLQTYELLISNQSIGK